MLLENAVTRKIGKEISLSDAEKVLEREEFFEDEPEEIEEGGFLVRILGEDTLFLYGYREPVPDRKYSENIRGEGGYSSVPDYNPSSGGSR